MGNSSPALSPQVLSGLGSCAMGSLVIVPSLVFASLLSVSDIAAQDPAPKELGAVDFARDLDAVLQTRPAKPVFLLFQEIPG